MGKGLILALSRMIFVLGSVAHAQFDSSAVLLKPSAQSGSGATFLDSNRYKVRTPESRKDEDDLDEKPGTFIPTPVPRAREGGSKVSVSTQAQVTTSPAPTTMAQPPLVPAPSLPGPKPLPTPLGIEQPAVSTPAPAVATLPTEHPPVTVQVRELILGGDEDIEQYKARLHPEDPRTNILTISLAPAYFYDGSTSNYSYRNYHSDGPGFGLGMNLWLSPFFGVQSKYFSSISSGVRDVNGVVGMDTQEFEAGVRFRRHFGYSRKSAQLSWGVDYHDSKGKIAKDATTVVGRESSGLSLALEGVVPTSVTYAGTFEVAIRPWQHSSELATSISPKSGAKNQTNAVDLELGGQWTLDRRNQVYWKGQYSVEKSLFSGTASEPDIHGGTPTGVSATNTLMIFYFGFRWGS